MTQLDLPPAYGEFAPCDDIRTALGPGWSIDGAVNDPDLERRLGAIRGDLIDREYEFTILVDGVSPDEKIPGRNVTYGDSLRRTLENSYPRTDYIMMARDRKGCLSMGDIWNLNTVTGLNMNLIEIAHELGYDGVPSIEDFFRINVENIQRVGEDHIVSVLLGEVCPDYHAKAEADIRKILNLMSL